MPAETLSAIHALRISMRARTCPARSVDRQRQCRSRYVEGGMTKNWGFVRRLISRGGSFYSRTILNLPIRDLTGGFNFWSRSCLETIDINSIISDGYVFQIELKYKAYLKGMKFIEFPIIFEDRRVGQSKMGKGIVFEALYKVFQLRRVVKAQARRNKAQGLD